MEINYYLNNMNDNETILLLNSSYNKKITITTDSIKDYLLSVSSISRVNKVLKMLNLSSNILDKNKNEISSLEESLIIIAWQLLQNKYLIIYYLDTLLNGKEKIYLRRLLSKISHEYNIKTIIFTNDIKFCFKLVDRIFIIDKKEIIKILDNDFYNKEIYKYIDMPDIISFVLNARQRGIKLDDYYDLPELLKGIYRL